VTKSFVINQELNINMIHELNLRNISEKWNIDHFGIADLSAASQFIESHYGDQLLRYPKVISIGINLFHDIINQLPNRKQKSVSLVYKHHCYNVINNRLVLIVSEMSSVLYRSGHRVLPICLSLMPERKKDNRISTITNSIPNRLHLIL
jgi:epoxyqueuosine reductase